MQANQEDVESRKRADSEGDFPAEGRNQQVGDAGGNEPANTPEAFEQDDKAAAKVRRRIFAHERSGYWQFTAEAKADEEAEEQQGFIAPGQGAHAGGKAVKQYRNGKYFFAADAVGKGSGQHSTECHADEADGANPANLCRGKTPLFGQHWQDKGDEARVHGVKEPAKARDEQQLILE